MFVFEIVCHLCCDI